MPQYRKNKLDGARILLFGGSSGIGFCVAESLLEQGASVVITSSTQERLVASSLALSKICDGNDARIFTYRTDLADKTKLDQNIAQAFSFATDKLGGKLNHVVYTAGDKLEYRGIRDATVEWIESIGLVRLVGATMVAKHVPHYVEQSPRSSITFTSGSVGDRPVAAAAVISAYCSSLDGLVRGLSRELQPLRFNAVAPGAVETDHLFGKEPTEERKQASRDRFLPETTTGELGQPEDVAEAYLYIMKDPGTVGAVVKSSCGRLLT